MYASLIWLGSCAAMRLGLGHPLLVFIELGSVSAGKEV